MIFLFPFQRPLSLKRDVMPPPARIISVTGNGAAEVTAPVVSSASNTGFICACVQYTVNYLKV